MAAAVAVVIGCPGGGTERVAVAMTFVHVHLCIRLPGGCDDAIKRVYRWLPWTLLKKRLRRAGAVEVKISAEAS